MRLLILAAAAVAAVSSPALAQDVRPMAPPPVTAPIYPVDGNENYMVSVAGGTLTRSGDIARITVIGLSSAGMNGTNPIARLDSVDEFNCSTRQSRSTGVAAYRADGSLLESFAENTPWEAINADTPNETMLTYVCGGEPPVPTGAETVDQIAAFYRQWLTEQ